MIKRFYILLLAIVASVGMSFAQAPGIVDSGTKGGMSYTFYDNGLLEISGSGALPGSAFTNWNGGFGTSVKNIRFAEDCEVYGLDYMWFACYTEKSQLETIEINSVTPIMFSGSSGAGITYKQDGAVTITITAPGIVDIENKIIRNYGSPVNMIFNMPATTVFEKKWFSSLENYFAVTIPTGAKGHIPGGYSFTNPYDQQDYDHFVEMGHEADFWEYNGDRLTEGVDYTLGVESTFVITAENASQIFGQATVSFQAPTEASNSEWVLWRKSDLKTFSDMSSGDQKVYKDVTVKVNNGVYNTDSGFGVHFDSSDEDGVQFVAPEGKVFKRIVILNEYGTFSDPNWSYDGNYKKWSGSANTVGFEGDICGISLIEFEVEDSAPAAPSYYVVGTMNSWTESIEYMLVPNSAAEGEYLITLDLHAGDQLKVKSGSTWYPDGMDNNYTVTTDGNYTIYFRPNGDGGDDWHYHVIYAAKNAPADPVQLPAIKYAVCNVPDGWTVTANGDAVLPINGRYHIVDGQTVVLTPSILTNEYVVTSEEPALVGAGTAEDPYLIYTVAQWDAVAAKVNDGSQPAAHCIQMANLDGITTVMGNSESKPFKGIYDGNGFIFSNINLSITSGTNPLGLFGCVNDASAVVKNVVVSGGTVTSVNRNIGAIVGQLNGGTVQYCANYATISSSYDGSARIGGIVGWMRSAGGENNRVDHCINYGNVSGVGYVGGIAGSCGAGYVSYCQNYGSLSSSGTDDNTNGSAGGIIGWHTPTDATKITYNHNGGNIIEAAASTYGGGGLYLIANGHPFNTPASNSYSSLMILTIGSTSYKGEQLATHDATAQAVTANPEGITISGITYAYNTPAPIAPAPGTNPGTDPAKQSNKTWQFTMPSHNIGLTVTIVPTEVIALINQLPNPMTAADVKLSVYTKVQDARAAYDALTAEQKALVEAATLKRLTDAEAAFDAIGGGGKVPATGFLKGKFSVAENSQICFAKGNLQATTTDLGANWTWSFAEHQYDYIGNAVANTAVNGNKTVSTNGTIDLLGWSTESTYYGIHNSANPSDYTGEFVDWGNLAISNGGNTANAGWRTLEYSEWYYLLITRTNAAQLFGLGSVKGENGVILLPDNWTTPSGVEFHSGAEMGMELQGAKYQHNGGAGPDPNDYEDNTYTVDQWALMEAAGAVFLPAAGDRYETTVTDVNTIGHYWSSTVHPDNAVLSYETRFLQNTLGPGFGNGKPIGQSVRLVAAVNLIADAQAAVALINAIPNPVTLDEACVKAIKDARAAVTALGEASSLIDAADMAKLTDAEAALTALNQAEADKVIAKINNIPQPVKLKLATRDSIESARAAYDALTADQKALVTNYGVLTAAEATMATLNPGGGAPLPEGALTGAFSINAGGSKIAFSKGNLQATTANLGETWTWAFAANQYDYVGNAVANTAITGNKTVSTNGTIDLFGWSTAATYYGINNSNVSGKHPGDFIDWGETIAEGWRTLTRDEWNYLLETRTDAASKYGHATVAGIHGIIVLPDSYKGTAINADHSDWSNNIISAEDWAAYEANGVAFLPAAGSRLTTNVNYVGEYGLYWTSTTYGEKWAYRVRFLPNLSPDYGDRVPGHSVRLVTAHTGSPTPLDSAQVVKDLIEAIPMPVTLEDACVNAVQAARDAYNALSDATKGALDDATVQKLNQAIADYTALIQAGADAVKAKIANIPQPVDLKLATRDSIESARAAYDALTADQKALVTNYAVLEAAEAALAALNPGGGMPADALNGKFTINAGGDQIAFAKGNLQATTEDLGEHWTWGFAANQWNYLGIAVANSKINGNGTVSENGTVDLFGWSTAATYYGINNSDKAVDYIGDFVDWGPKMGAGWRTLTKDEWQYLIENNTKGRATVNDKSGYIFLPNDWSGPAFTPDPDNFTTNVYSGDDWTAMENAGAVFLPSGPARNRTYALIANDAKYSSSTSLNNDTSCVFTIYYNQSQSACTGTNRAYGCMVRLVTEGGGATPLDSAQVVKDLIEAIPAEITLDAACVKAIEDARAAYDALSEATKGALDAATVKKLTDAEAALTALNQAEADKVIAKINAIPTPVELKLATRDSINNARAAYDALNADQKALVSNYTKLTDAEAALAALNPGGSIPVDIVWDGNTGIANVDPNTTSPAYEGMTVTVGAGSSFSTYQNRLYFTFYSQPNGGFIFANADGSNITKVVIESATALTSTMTEVDRMGSGWVISNENTTATWTGNADSVSIWQGQSFTNYWVVDTITFTVNGVGATPLDSAQVVKDLIDAIPDSIVYPTSGPAIEAALVAYNQLSDAAKGALDAADVQKLTNAATLYAALDAIAAIENIPDTITYDPLVKAAIETARAKYDTLSTASKALVGTEVLHKLTNAEEAWAILVAKIEHNVSYIGKYGELMHETVALLHIPDPAPEFNGYEFVRWDVKAGDFLEEGLRIKAVYSPIITTNPVAYDSLMYNATAQTLITAGEAKEGHIEYRINDGEWSTELPKATFAAAYVVYYKLVREGHADYIADSIVSIIAKAPVVYTAPTAVDSLVYNAANQTLIAAGTTADGTFEYSLDPTLPDSWKTELPKAMGAGTYSVYYRVQGDLNHLDSTAVNPIAVTISKAALTATADNKNVTYGDAVPAYTVTYAGWQGDDDTTALTGKPAYTCTYAPTSNVGEYPITPSGVSAANYDITFVNGKVTVAKAESGCIAPVVYDTLVYNGANQTLIIAGQPMGGEMQYSLDTTVLDCWSTSLPQAKDAGTYNVYYRVKGDMNHNDHYYDLITVSIAKAALTATADDKNVVYGDSVPEYTVSYSGWMGTDESSVLTGTIAFACTYAPTSNVGEYTITPSGVDAANYIITFVNGKVTVNQAALMITADDKTVEYGEQAPAFTASYSGWKNADDASVVSGLLVTSAYLVTSSVGNYDIVPDSAKAMNYAISYTKGTLNVTKAPLTITAEDKTMIYGDVHPEFTATYAGWKNTDDAAVVSGLAYTTPYQPGSAIGTYAIEPNSATAQNYAISFVNGTLTVNKAVVSVSGAEAQVAKFADGHANAVVLNAGQLNGIKLSDPIAHVTTATFSSADVAENLTITLFYELTGDANLLGNYDLQPTNEIFSTEGVIIEPFHPDTTQTEEQEEEQTQVQEGIDVYAFGYCDGSGYSLKYHLNTGNPDQYKIDFADSRFTNVPWTNLETAGKDGTIDIEIPVDMPTGDYTMTVYFRDSRFTWLESQALTVTFHVNLPETFVRPLFDNTIVLVDTCECFTDIQWYYREDSSQPWEPIPGATGHYYRPENGEKLTGEYFVFAKMNGVPTYTCGQADMETLYGEGKLKAQVKAYPNPVVHTTTVTIEGSDRVDHTLRIVNLMGVEMMNTTFEGNETIVDMDGYIQGNYMISVDGIVVKVMKQ